MQQNPRCKGWTVEVSGLVFWLTPLCFKILYKPSLQQQVRTDQRLMDGYGCPITIYTIFGNLVVILVRIYLSVERDSAKTLEKVDRNMQICVEEQSKPQKKM